MLPYKPVRALDRGLDVLLALNAGPARPAELAATTGIDRTTIYRLLATLMQRGLVARSPAADRYFLLRDVQRLSEGFVETDQLRHTAARALGQMLPQVKWPSDFCVFDRGAMVICETTHRFSTLSIHRAMVGRKSSMTRSATGRAVLAGASPEECAHMLALAETLQGEKPPSSLAPLQEDFARRGYAWAVGSVEPHISAIAVPVVAAGRVLGSVNIVFFRRAATPEQIAAAHLADLQACAAAIAA